MKSFHGVEPNFRFPFVFVGTMARETSVRQDRSNVPIEFDSIWQGKRIGDRSQ
jgi:hypothetical protein